MTTRFACAGALALLALLSCFSDRSSITEPTGGECTVPATAFGRNRAVVIIRNFTFLSDTVRLRSGGTVTWVNCEDPDVEHTSTSNTGLWDSDLFAAGESFAHTFTAAGSFAYFCEPHPSMRGVVIIE